MRTAVLLDCQVQSSEDCNVTIEAVLAHSRECLCTDENPCNILQLLASICYSYSAPAANVSCVQEMTLCIQDEVCNRQLVPFVQSCSVPQCEERLCRLAARRFYSNLPENMAEMLVFCQCEPDDKDCQNFQTMLNSNSCKQDQIPQWNCLEMLDNCTEENICRKTFEAFLSKCFGPDDVSFTGHSAADLLHVMDLDFFVSGNKECRLAFVATMGTILQSPCTCHGLDHHHLYRCNVLRQAIHNRSYFNHLLYIVVCVCVVVVVVVISAVIIVTVKHKLGGEVVEDGGISGEVVEDGGISGKVVEDGGFSGKVVEDGGISGEVVKDGGFSEEVVEDGGNSGGMIEDGGNSGGMVEDEGISGGVV
ncbi:GDNF family receptor alpha-like [Silurus asotus]|uniref:GDNF family receptor alpha-like n=1 Tax=Silurus asotus TaxID=30991 RepID=A0AAD5A7Q1_SILAS|nr:GDNF family receptor alpha-like [Silurus asotus]